MSQEFESRVNELVVARNLPYNEAAEIVTRELAEEGVEETQKKKDTNSEPSDGRFTYIGEVEQPEISPLLPTASREFAISEYKSKVEDTNLLINSEFEKLQKLALKANSQQDRKNLYSQFLEETGVDIPEENFVNLESSIVESEERQTQFEAEYQRAFTESLGQNNFGSVKDVLKQYGFEEEKISEIENSFKAEQDKIEVTQGQVLEAWKSSFTAEELQQNLDSVNIPQEEKDLLFEDYNKYLTELGQGAYSAIFNESFDISQKILALEDSRVEVEKSDNLPLAKRNYDIELNNLKAQFKRAKENEADLVNISKDIPEVKPALAFVSLSRSRFIESLDPSVKDKVKSGELDMYEASWMTSDEYKEINESMPEVLADRYGTPLMNQDSKKEAMIEKAKDKYISIKKQEQTKREVDIINKYVPVGDDPDEKKALENAILRISGSAYDLENIDGKVGYETPWLTDAILKGGAALVDFVPTLFRTGQQAQYGVSQYARDLFSDSEERSILLERERELKTEAGKTFLNVNALDSARQSTTNYEAGIMDSFREGNYEAGIAQAVGMAAESLPITLATMLVSGGLGTVAGYGFASAISAGLEYEEVFQEEWFKGLSPLERSAYIGGVGAAEGLSESIGAGVASRFLKGGSSRAIGQIRSNYLRSRTKSVASEYLTDAGSEVGVTYAQAGLELAFNDNVDLSNLTDEAFESGIVSLITTGGMQTAGTINTVMSASTDSDVLFSGKDLQNRVNDILNTTTPGSKTRAQQIDLMLEDASVAAQIKADAFELHDFIRRVSPTAAEAISDNSFLIASELRVIETSTSKDEIKGARQTIEELINENKSLEMTMVEGFYSQPSMMSKDSMDGLKKRAANFARQAARLQKRGNESAASSLRSKAERIKGAVSSLEIQKELNESVKSGAIVSSKGKDVNVISDKITEAGINSVVVDAKIASSLEGKGYKKVEYSGSGTNQFLMVSSANPVALVNPQSTSFEEAQSEIALNRIVDSGSINEEFRPQLISELARMTQRGANETDLFKKASELLSDSEKSKVAEISERKLEDIEDKTKNPEAVLTESASQSLDVLSKAFSQTNSIVLSDLALTRRLLQDQSLTEDRKKKIKEDYLSGLQGVNAFYDKNSGEVFLTERATSKDVVEEYAHSYIHKKLQGVDNVGKQLRSDLNGIMESDQILIDAVSEKMRYYKEEFGANDRTLAEEKYVEIIAAYVANEQNLKASTIERMTQFFAKLFPSFTESGGSSRAVLDKLSKSLRDGNSQSVSDQFEELFKLDPSEQAKVDGAQQVAVSDQAAYSANRRPTFLDNKKVTYQKAYDSAYDSTSRDYGRELSYTFNDYFHFANWYRKMTGNGAYTRIGRMTYVDDSGNVKTLNPPKQLLDRNTGVPVVMQPAMKSMYQTSIERGQAEIKERNERRLSAIKAEQLAKEQLWEIMRRTDPGIGGGNANSIINSLMSDFTPEGVNSETKTNRFGDPIKENVKGSPEYHEVLLDRVNDYVQENYAGESILYSAAFRRSLSEASDMKPAQKRKLLEDGLRRTKDLLDPETLNQINLYLDQAGDKKIGSGVPAHLMQQMYFAMLIQETQMELILNGNDLTKNKEDMSLMSEVVAKELMFVDDFLNKNPRNFYKNFYNQVNSTKNKDGSYNDPLAIQTVGKSQDSEGNFTVDNPQKLELARKHKDLLVAIIAVTSNGNRAVPNLSESLRIYSSVLEDLLQTPGKNPSKVDFARTKLLIESITSQGLKASQFNGQRSAVPIAVGLKNLLNIDGISNGLSHYRFEAPSTFKRNALKKTGDNRISIQDSLGNWSKVGAFMSNLYQDQSVITQDRHLVNYLDSRYRPSEVVSFQVGDVLSVLREFEYGRIDAVQKEWMVTTSNGSTTYDLKKVAKWVKDNMGSKSTRSDGTVVCTGDNLKKELRYLYDNHMTQKGSAGKLFDSNIEVVDSIVEQLRKKRGYKSVTRSEVMQMIFAANHVLPQAVGVSNRIYDDFSQETFEKAIEKLESSSVQQGTPDEMLSRFTKIPEIENDFKGKSDSEKLQAYIDRADLSEGMGQFIKGENTEVVMFSAKRTLNLSAHPQSRSYNLPGIFKGRSVKSMQNVKFGTGKIDISKLLEGRASEVNVKGKVSEDKPSDQFDEFVEGVVFMRHPLHGDSFVDSYGNIIKSAEQVYMSGDVIIASGKVRYAGNSIERGKKSENIVIENPEHFRAFNNFMSIMKQRNQSLANESTEMFEMAYKSLTAKDRARFANLTIDEHGNVIKGRRLRGTSKRLANSSEFGRFKNEIVSNPENYIDRQSIANEKKNLEDLSAQELVSLMRGDALDNLATRNDDVGVLAGIELINRMQETGNDIGIAGVLDRLAAVGTTAGRILRHMAELKTSSPQGMASVIIKKAEAQGKILSEEQKNKILEATKTYMAAYKKAQDLLERGIAGEDVEAEFKKAKKDLNETQSKLDTLANMYTEKTWSEIGTQLVQGNLLTMMSQSRNVVYNLANVIPKTVIDIMSMPTSKAFELMGLHKEKRKLSLAGYLYALRKFGAGSVEAMEQVITGREEDMSEWRMSRGFMPIRSLMAAMSSDLPEGVTLRNEVNQRAKLLVQGTFGIPAEAMFRLLSLGDVPFRRFAEGLELYSIAKGKGLEGDALAQFLKFPDKGSAEQGATEGRKLTFQEPMGLARGSMWIIDNISRGMGEAFKNVKGFDAEGFFKYLIRLNVPYVSTIANFTEETLTYASPVFGIGKMGIQMSNKDYTEASKTLSKVMVGQAISTTALHLISQGLLSGSVDWEDDEKTNLMYDTFPPNSINVDGLRRMLEGGDPAPQAGDEFRSYQTLGVFGTIMGAYAHSTSPEAAKEMAEQPFSGNNALKKVFGFDNVSVMAYMMDQSFLQGLNGITSVISSTKDPEDFERAFFRYAETISKAFSSMFLPNVLSGVDQSTREFMPDKRDVDLADRIKNHVRERTFNTGGLPVKVNWKGERIDQAPVGGNQFAYYMFDATKMREASQDDTSIEILNLYLRTGVLTKAVGTPYYASSVYRKIRKPSVRRGKAKKAYEALGVTYSFLENPEEDFNIKLTAEEVNNALEMSNVPRYNEIKSFIQTEEYQAMTDVEKIESLDDINGRYKSLLSYNPDGSFMEHSKYILDLMESRYLEQNGQN